MTSSLKLPEKKMKEKEAALKHHEVMRKATQIQYVGQTNMQTYGKKDVKSKAWSQEKREITSMGKYEVTTVPQNKDKTEFKGSKVVNMFVEIYNTI